MELFGGVIVAVVCRLGGVAIRMSERSPGSWHSRQRLECGVFTAAFEGGVKSLPREISRRLERIAVESGAEATAVQMLARGPCTLRFRQVLE